MRSTLKSPAWLRHQARYCVQQAEVTDHPVIRAGLLACAATLCSEADALERITGKSSAAGPNPPNPVAYRPGSRAAGSTQPHHPLPAAARLSAPLRSRMAS
jgi:hypothetical protein